MKTNCVTFNKRFPKGETVTLTNGTANTSTGFARGTNYSQQVGTITYSGSDGSNSPFVRHHVEAERALGRVVVFDNQHARVHLA